MNTTDFLHTLNGDGIVQARWPYDGPHSPDTVREAADALAALVRYLNNATSPGNGEFTLRWAPHTNDVLAGITGAIAGCEQLLDQLEQRACHYRDDPTLYDDRRDRPGQETAVSLANALTDAHSATGQLHDNLHRARVHASHLGHDLADEQDTTP